MFSHCHLRVNGRELRTHAQVMARKARVSNDRGVRDKHVSAVWNYVPTFTIMSARLCGGVSGHSRIILNVVVFPAPFGPSIAKMVFWGTPKLTLSTTVFLWNRLETWSTRSRSFELSIPSASAATSSGSAALVDCLVKPRGRTDPEAAQKRMASKTKE